MNINTSSSVVDRVDDVLIDEQGVGDVRSQPGAMIF